MLWSGDLWKAPLALSPLVSPHLSLLSSIGQLKACSVASDPLLPWALTARPLARDVQRTLPHKPLTQPRQSTIATSYPIFLMAVSQIIPSRLTSRVAGVMSLWRSLKIRSMLRLTWLSRRIGVMLCEFSRVNETCVDGTRSAGRPCRKDFQPKSSIRCYCTVLLD